MHIYSSNCLKISKLGFKEMCPVVFKLGFEVSNQVFISQVHINSLNLYLNLKLGFKKFKYWFEIKN